MRIAMIGCGYVADMYVQTMVLHPELDLVAVFDRDRQRLEQFTNFYGLNAAASMDAILEDASISMVLNLTNPRSHYEVSKACLGAGKHVYSEKPLAMAVPQAVELVELAESAGLLLASAPCSVLGECAQTLWKAVRANAVGRIHAVYAEMDDGLVHRMAYRDWLSKSGAPWPAKDEFEVGCTLEHAGYVLTWLCAMFGPATNVTAFGSTTIPDKLTDEPLSVTSPDLTVGCIRFSSGVVARLTCSIVAPHDHHLQMFGEDGILGTDETWDYRSPVWVKRLHVIRRRMIVSPIKRKLPLAGKKNPFVKYGRASQMDFCRGAGEMVAALDEDRPCRLSSHFLVARHRACIGIAGSRRIRHDPDADDLVFTHGAHAVGEVNFGILGTGQAAGTFARALLTVPNARLGAVGSRHQQRGDAFASRFGITKAYGSYAEAARDPGLDVLYVATPAYRHTEDALTCLEANKGVLVEKPFAPTAAQAERIIAAARQKGLFCMEAMWTRFVPGFRRAIERIDSGEMGDPTMLFADFGAPVAFDPESHYFDRDSGGAWLDRGVYGASLAVALFGDPVHIVSSASLASTGCDLQSSAILEFADGQLALLSASTTAYTANEALVAGPRGRLRLAETFVRPEILLSRPAPKSAEPIGDDPSGSSLKDRLRSSSVARRLRAWLPRESREFVPHVGDGYHHEAVEVVRCLTAGEHQSPLMSWEESVVVAKINDGVRAAWRRPN